MIGQALLLAALTMGQVPQATDAVPDPSRRWLEALGAYMLDAAAPGSFPRTERQAMLTAILHGSRMGPGDGWFKPGQHLYGWSWLAQRCGKDRDGRITSTEFPDKYAVFQRLDRDRDGQITPSDFDWSDQSPFLRMTALFDPFLYRLDGDSNGRVSRKEWQAFFDKASAGKDDLTPEDLRQLLLPPQRPAGKSAPSGMPPTKVLLKGLFNNELGSPYEGPRVGQQAPLFTLPKFGGDGTISLGSLLGGKKPVVLVFGSFT